MHHAWGFPMCAGAIEGTHIAIRAPIENHTHYVNRMRFHSVLMQAVVDCKYLFRDVVIRWPGSVHDARTFSNSTIFTVTGNENRLFPNDLTKEICGENVPPVILTDAAYPLLRLNKLDNFCVTVKGEEAVAIISGKKRLPFIVNAVCENVS